MQWNKSKGRDETGKCRGRKREEKWKFVIFLIVHNHQIWVIKFGLSTCIFFFLSTCIFFNLNIYFLTFFNFTTLCWFLPYNNANQS